MCSGCVIREVFDAPELIVGPPFQQFTGVYNQRAIHRGRRYRAPEALIEHARAGAVLNQDRQEGRIDMAYPANASSQPLQHAALLDAARASGPAYGSMHRSPDRASRGASRGLILIR